MVSFDRQAAYDWLSDNAWKFMYAELPLDEDRLFEKLCEHLGLDSEVDSVVDAVFPVVVSYCYVEGYR